MIHGLVRSPCFYFDVTPTGRLNNNFSNDLGILDNSLSYLLTDALEGPIVTIILLANVFTIDLYFIIPGLFSIILVALFFKYCKRAIINAKQLDLRLKNPIFNMVGQMLNGLIQIKIYNKRFLLLK